MPLPETFEVELVASELLAPSVRGLSFTRVDGHPIVHEPGQWLNLALPATDPGVRRAYSIASAPSGSPTFEIAVTHVLGGPGSGFLFSLVPGARLRATGPQGFFTRGASDPSPALLVATGTGVTPFRSMILAALRAGAVAPLTLLLGVRHEDDLLYRAELEALSREHPTFEAHFTLSRPSENWSARRGYVQEHVAPLFRALERNDDGNAPAAPHLYVCGLERMVKAVRAIGKSDLALPRDRIHGERYD